MTWRLAKSLTTLREEIDAIYPGRDKSSDGSIGDASHSARKSDHNPNSAGVVTAIDVDRDLAPGHDAREIVTALQRSHDPRIKYIIFERQITVKGDVTQWKPYHGPSPHDHHFHISVSSDPRLYDDGRAWNISAAVSAIGNSADTTSTNAPLEPVTEPPEQPPILKRGSRGKFVVNLQNKLIELGYELKADGIFGPQVESILRTYQRSVGLDADGKCGPATRAALGL